MFRAIADGFGYLYGLLEDLFKYLLDGIWTLLMPIFELLGAIFYLIATLGRVLVKIFEVVLGIGKLLIGVISGLLRTIWGLAYTPGSTTTFPTSYSSVFAKIMPVVNSLQLDKVAYILIFGIWLTAGFYAIKIIGEMRGNGGSD